MFGRMGRDFGRLGASSGGAIGWIPNRANSPDIAINWTTNQAWLKTTGLTTPATLGVTTSRASVKQVVDSNGNWSQVAANVTAMTDLGRSTEEARTNSIRNNTMQGAIAGSPGTLPTNWNTTFSANGGTLATSVIGTGTESGIDYIDVRLSGTPAAGGGVFELFFDTGGAVSAARGQTWSNSAFIKIVGGGVTNAAPSLGFRERNTGLLQDDLSSVLTLAGSAAALGSSRQSFSATLANAASTNIYPFVGLTYATAAAIDITLRIGWPQAENDTNINSTVASAVAAASGTAGVNGTGVYSVAGTGTPATLNCTWAAGILTVNSVASAGSYTAFPAAGALLTYVSGTATGWTGATVNATPTNLAANAFATSPIKTTAAAATRAADVTTLTVAPGSGYTLFEQATPQAPITYGVRQNLLTLDDGTTSNGSFLDRNLTTGLASLNTEVAGVGQGNPSISASAWAQNASGKVAAAFSGGPTRAGSFNGSAAYSDTTAVPSASLTKLSFGSNEGGGIFNGLAAIDAIWLTQAVPSAQLVTMTT